MAHNLTMPKGSIITSIPVTVWLQSMPCVWKPKPQVRKVIHFLTDGQHKTEKTPGFWCTERPEINGVRFDARSVRETFFSLNKPNEFLDFLNKTGRFFPAESWLAEETLRACQLFFQELLTHRPAKWPKLSLKGGWDQADIVENALNNANTLPIQFRWHGEKYAALIEAHDVVTAILATILIDHLRDTKYRYCKRPDCGKLFEVTRNGKIYCDLYCGHLVSLRNTRKRKATSS